MAAKFGTSRWAVALLLLGAALRASFVHAHPPASGDAVLYADLAQNMLRHHIYGFTEGARIRSTLIRLPGYPAFLAACFALFGDGNLMCVLWVQAALDLAGWAMLAALAQRLWGRRVGFATLALGMLCPFTAVYCAVALTETLVMFATVVAMVGLERWTVAARTGRVWNMWLTAIGGALVYGIFLRPDQGLLAVVVVAGMLWVAWRSGCKQAAAKASNVVPVAAMCGLMALPFVLWGLRNWSVFHVVQPLAPRYANDPGEPNPAGFQKWYRTWAIDFKATVDFYWAWDGSPVAMLDLPARAIDNDAQRAETARLFALYAKTNASSAALDAGMERLAEERIAANPLRYYVWVPALKVADMWLRPRTEWTTLPLDWWSFRAHERASWECLGLAAWNAAYLALGLVGCVVWRRRGWDVMLAVMVGFVMLRCALLWTIDNSEMRYTLECFPMVVLLGAVGLERLVRKA